MLWRKKHTHTHNIVNCLRFKTADKRNLKFIVASIENIHTDHHSSKMKRSEANKNNERRKKRVVYSSSRQYILST